MKKRYLLLLTLLSVSAYGELKVAYPYPEPFLQKTIFSVNEVLDLLSTKAGYTYNKPAIEKFGEMKLPNYSINVEKTLEENFVELSDHIHPNCKINIYIKSKDVALDCKDTLYGNYKSL